MGINYFPAHFVNNKTFWWMPVALSTVTYFVIVEVLIPGKHPSLLLSINNCPARFVINISF
jgi:hypothetical protein